MAALQSIRNHNKLLVGIIGLALFLFIIQLFFDHKGQSVGVADIGSIYGKSLTVQEYEDRVGEFSDFLKFIGAGDRYTREDIREMVWNNYVATQVVERECQAFGIDVCNDEIERAYNEALTPTIQTFANLNIWGGANYRQIIAELERRVREENVRDEQVASLLNAWNYVKHNVRNELLLGKYDAIVSATAVGNDIEGKANFEARNNQFELELSALPYTAVPDTAVNITADDLKKKYNELKPRYYRNYETRTAQYIRVPVFASASDTLELRENLLQVAQELETAEAGNVARIVSAGKSSIAYSGFYCSEDGLPMGIASVVKEMEVGEVHEPFTTADNTMNVVRLVGKTLRPDSVEVNIIPAMDVAQADSIILCHKGGEPIDSLIAHQGGETRWINMAHQPLANTNTAIAQYLNLIMNLEKGQSEVFDDVTGLLSGGQYHIAYVINLKDCRQAVEKYDVAVVKRDIDFSTATMNQARNNLSRFLANNLTADKIRENVMNEGYEFRDATITQREYGIKTSPWERQCIAGSGAIKHWLFNEAEKNQVSDIFECGNNDVLMVAILKDVYPIGYLPIDHPTVDADLRTEIMREKKAAILKERMNGKSAAEVAAMPNAFSQHVDRATVADGITIPYRAAEYNLSGVLAGKGVGDVIPAVSGTQGVYTMQVISHDAGTQEYNAETERRNVGGMYAVNAQSLIGQILDRVEITDNRYLIEK